MKTLMIAGAACTALLATDGFAHGGVYRGPGDTVPPGVTPHGPKTGAPGQPGPVTPGPTVPGAPTPTGPITPPPGVPSAPPTGGPGIPSAPGGPKTPRGMVLSADLSKWQFWWEFNKDPFINLRDKLHAPAVTTGDDNYYMGSTRRVDSKNTSKPSDSDIQDTIIPTLKRALDNTDNRDVNSSCVMALAKIGQDGANFKILELFEKMLKKPDQEIRETAAIAMGISGMPKAIEALTHLATDDEAGRKLCSRTQVDNRTRAFACYGLGLIAHGQNDLDLKRKAFEALSAILLDDAQNERNVKVAAIHGIALLNLQAVDGKDAALLKDALASLDEYYSKKLGRGSDLIKSHVPTAIAKLIGRGDSSVHAHYKTKFAGQMTSRKKQANDIYRSCALALGQIALPRETAGADKLYSKTLLKHFHNGRDQQARYFSLMALGQIGGNANRKELLTVLAKGNKALERPWAALSLGVMEFHRLKSDDAKVDTTVGDAIAKQLKAVKNPESRGAFAVALGLSRYREASGELMDLLEKYGRQDELAGYLCLGLALMDCRKAREPIHNVVRRSVRRPELLRQAAVALGRLGDKSVTTTLTNMLQEKESNLAKLSAIAAALGFIGDRRTIEPLKKMLHNEELGMLSRAFAAVALGGVADKEKLPWNSKIARNINYRGSVETLTQSGTGVLEIL